LSVPPYRVQLIPRPIVIDTSGLPVPDSYVIEIAFPGDAIVTLLGSVNIIIGPGVAKILVDDTTIRGVLLC
jgi:hypothetical protein